MTVNYKSPWTCSLVPKGFACARVASFGVGWNFLCIILNLAARKGIFVKIFFPNQTSEIFLGV